MQRGVKNDEKATRCATCCWGAVRCVPRNVQKLPRRTSFQTVSFLFHWHFLLRFLRPRVLSHPLSIRSFLFTLFQRVSRLDLEITVSSLRHFSHRLNLQLQREPSCDHTLAQWFSMVLPAACEILSKFFRVGYEKPAETCKMSFVAALPCLPSPWLVLQSRKFTLLFLRNSAPNDPNNLQSQMCLCI